MCRYREMKRKEESHHCEMVSLSDTCATLLFTLFVFALFLFMFTYADSLSQARERSFGGHDKYVTRSLSARFAVKQYTWQCREARCVRTLAGDGDRTSLDTCNMLCSQPPIWPKPRNLTVANKNSSAIDLNAIDFTGSALPRQAVDSFLDNFRGHNVGSTGLALNVHVALSVSNLTTLRLDTSEAYRLSVREQDGNISASIQAENYFGARHALETLSQLMWYDQVGGQVYILHDVEVDDWPRFGYRGVMVDTARNFFPLPSLKRIIDGMAMSKLNVLHLHLTDSVSFPVALPSVKELAEFGAYAPDMVYTAEDMEDLVQYARVRGVRVVPEVDTPGHVSAGWAAFGQLVEEEFVICGEEDVFGGQLNPDNPAVLGVVERVYSDLLALVGNDEIFHIGADEVSLDCWRGTKAAQSFREMHSFWANYTNRILERLRAANLGKDPERVVMWSSPLTEHPAFDEVEGNVTVQFWLGKPYSFLRTGHPVIYSTVGHWYLDCGFGPWRPSMTRGVCDPYTPWQTVYRYRPWKEYGYEGLTLGGEVCLWTEQVEVDSLETRVWPRAAAFAERVWADPEEVDDYDVSTRLARFRERLGARGIRSEAMWPRWCSLNPGRC